MSDLSRLFSCRALPVFLKREVLDVCYRFVNYKIKSSHIHTALCERHCKITKKKQTDKMPVCFFSRNRPSIPARK